MPETENLLFAALENDQLLKKRVNRASGLGNKLILSITIEFLVRVNVL